VVLAASPCASARREQSRAEQSRAEGQSQIRATQPYQGLPQREMGASIVVPAGFWPTSPVQRSWFPRHQLPDSLGSCSQAWPWRAAHPCRSRAVIGRRIRDGWPRVACGRDRCEEKVRRGVRRSLFVEATGRRRCTMCERGSVEGGSTPPVEAEESMQHLRC
jgi:hypothetical protein